MKNLREFSRDPRAGRLKELIGAARAYLAGVGTTGSLLAGAVLMFIVASALVAFRGWPHVGPQPSPGEVLVSPQAASPSGSPTGRRLALISATAPIGGGAPAAGLVPGALPGLGRSGPPSTRRSIGKPASTSIPVGTPPATGGLPPSSCVVGGCGSTSSATPGSGPAQQATQVVQRAAGSLGTVLTGAGGRVGTVVQQTTTTVGGAIQGTSPPAGGAVNGAGSGVAKAIGGATQTIVGALSAIGTH